MAKISAKQVKELRDMTGVGMMAAKKALMEVDGDIDKAVDFLRAKGVDTMAKKADRIAAEGLAATYVSGNTAAIVEVNSETDFVAKNESFQEMVEKIVKTIVEQKPADNEAVLGLDVDGQTVKDLIIENTSKIGEKLSFRRFAILEKTDNDVFGEYIHAGGRIAALVLVEGMQDEEMAKDVAMHVAAINPQYVSADQVPQEVYDHEKQIQTEKSLAEGKPANIVEKMVEGRMGKFLAEISLVDQPFVKDSALTVAKYLAEKGGKAKSFVRFEVGEGMEKRNDDFAAEVASQMGK
ncbi:translation elongation factor Ts [Ignavigranum ruoffiae]|uniref:Elongation factor Ts n=1 Tax=Ignavigranum ruoffiae TaxID=89093 RepID=A0A1H8Z323_9LACT|nr:translation elongation factor Ts [Ignavigranum ruoffiae]UPQ85458.1 translation elongation factor Ts [Ignavigranum ruoffiae]SEP58667.1 elongation factor Ts [Ignavigranum ruoffiae]